MTLFKSKKQKLEEKFAKLNQTTIRKEALEYVVHKKQGALSELREKVDPQVIDDFEKIGYIKITGENYESRC